MTDNLIFLGLDTIWQAERVSEEEPWTEERLTWCECFHSWRWNASKTCGRRQFTVLGRVLIGHTCHHNFQADLLILNSG